MRRFDPGTRLVTGGVTAPAGSYERHPQLRGQRAAAGTPQRHVTGYQQRPIGENGRNLTARIQHRLAHRQAAEVIGVQTQGSNCFLHRSAVPCGLPAQSSQSKAPGFMMSKSALLKVILLGDGGVGKSSLMNRYVTNKFDSHLFHTIGVEFLNKELEVDGRRVTLQIWDTAGQERFRSLRTPFYRGSDCCLLTFSLDDGQSFQNLANWKKEFTYYADIKDPDSFPFVVLGNKLDIPERQVSGEDARKWCRENGGHPYFETSAKDATNVASAFEEAVRRIQMTDDRDGHLISTDTNTVDLQRKSQAQNSCC
ncbi:ras-related protein Rab-9A isoform X1 [Haplochromis burtoni]|uniref:ras-related protein Rab-9A isoform X1 n=2 Tax=Pseudocrenilabrinae TaxID=318546 RepID=UPI001C2D73F9|nr:ras-related protein Rab-9A isoform X1 [Haplochromis burtoni]